MKKAFTLIELLVVIAIIAILAAMLMPALGEARRAAMKVQCAANENAVGKGIAMYQLDNSCLPDYGAWMPDMGMDWQLGSLYPTYVNSVNAFDCPEGAETDPSAELIDVVNDTWLIHNYDYEIDDFLPQAMGPMRAIYGDENDDDNDGTARESGEMNHIEGSNILFKDCHVIFVELTDVGGLQCHQNPYLTVDTRIYALDTLESAGSGTWPNMVQKYPLVENDCTLEVESNPNDYYY